MAAPEYFPLPWYLKDYPAGYYGRIPNTRDAIFIGSTKQDDALKTQLGAGFVRSGPYSLRPGVDLVVYVRQDSDGAVTSRVLPCDRPFVQ